MAVRRIQEFLDGSHARYVLMTHEPAYTAQEVAESVHVRGQNLLKNVIIRIDGKFAFAVVPACKDVDVDLLRRQASAQEVRVAEEYEFADRFQGCQVGAVPPFGNLFGVDTFVDSSVAKQEFIAFNAGTHTHAIGMRFDDYRRLVGPKMVQIASDPIGVRFHVAQI